MNNTTQISTIPNPPTSQNINTTLYQNQAPEMLTAAEQPAPTSHYDHTTEQPAPSPTPHHEPSAPSLTAPQKHKPSAPSPTAPQKHEPSAPSPIFEQDVPPLTEELRRQIATHKQRMQEYEIGDDGYYLSRQYQEDMRLLYDLEQTLKKLSNHKQE